MGTRQIEQLVHEVERRYSPSADIARQLEYLLEGVIDQAPTEALQLLKTHAQNTADHLPRFQCLLAVLADRLLGLRELQSAEDLMRLALERGLAIDATFHRKLAKAYRDKGDAAKAREVLYSITGKKAVQNPDVLRDLYDIARAEGQDMEAHALLNQLVQVDPSQGTVALAYRERSGLTPAVGRPVRIALMGSYTIDPVVPNLDFECRIAGLVPTFYVAPFNQYMQEALIPSSQLYQFKPEIVFIHLAVEDLFPEIKGHPSVDELTQAGEEIRRNIRTLVEEISTRSDAIIVVNEFILLHRSPHGLLDNRSPNGLAPWIEDLNKGLEEYFRTQDRGYLLPFRAVVGRVGIDGSNNPKMCYMAGMRLSGAALPALANYSMRYIKPLKGLTRKCLVLDLDGTLWGGVAGELGMDGIQLGPSAPGMEFVDFQEALLSLTKRGILLALSSKNNPDDVLPIIRNHPYMRLREENFAAVRINWRNKAENINEIADELNIGLDSMVFFDDNPNERELIRQLLPEVLTVDLPSDPSRFRETLEAMTDFELLALTKEDEERGAQYQAMQRRRVARSATVSIEEYLHSLEIQAEIDYARAEHVNRLVQMFNKTNQFNLTTRRYQSADFDRFLAGKDFYVYTLNVQDRFGDHGLVGAAIVRKAESDWHIDSLLMSCRVMGLSVETAFLHRIWADASRHGAKALVSEFIATKKNTPVLTLYRDHGFTLMKEKDEQQFWQIDVSVKKIEKPAWINLTGESQHHDS